MDKVKRQMREKIKEGVASGVAAVGKGTEVLRSLLGSADQPTKVQEVKSDAYTSRHILSREDSLVLYEPSAATGKRDKAYYEIILHRPFTESLDQAYSLFRAETQDDAEVKFICFKDTIPVIVDVAKEMGHLANLQKLCDCLTEHPVWSTAHLAAHFSLNEAFQHTAVNSQLNCSDPVTGESPLQVAVRAGHLKTVARMVGAKCSLEHLDFTGNSVYHFAAETNKEIIAALVQGTTPPRCLNARNHAGYTPLHLACRSDKPGCVKALLLAGADVNIEAAEAREGAAATSLPSPPTSPSGSNVSGILSPLGNLPGYVGNFVQDNPNKLHAQDMKYGGTPLHWACSKEVIETLVDMNCHINALNFNKRTALHIMVLRGRLDCIVALLARQADPDLGDMDGNRPIHLAIQQGNVSIVQSLIIFGAQLDLQNNEGHTARHEMSRDLEPKLLYYLHAVGASRCAEDMVDCTDGCRINGEYNGDSPPSPLPPTNRDILNQMLAQAATNLRTTNTPTDHGGDTTDTAALAASTIGGRILCLDGGGIRGLVLIQMLLEIEVYLEGKPVNNCFDWISGTSTGGILALGIATGKTMKECLCLYFRMKEVSFAGFRPYPSEALESVLQETFGVDSVMTDIKSPKVLVTGCLADRKPVELHLFRNYQAPLDVLGITDPLTRTPGGTMEPPAPPAQQRIWQVGRASGAAPTYFRQFQQFLDGGLIANNPTMDTLSEVHEYNLALRAVGRDVEITPPSIVVSLGTGLIPVSQMSEYAVESIWQGLKLFSHLGSLGTLLVDQATSSDGRVVDRARAWCSMIGVPYFRFSPQMSEEVAMDEKNNDRLVRLLWETKAYMYSNQTVLREMAKLLMNE